MAKLVLFNVHNQYDKEQQNILYTIGRQIQTVIFLVFCIGMAVLQLFYYMKPFSNPIKYTYYKTGTTVGVNKSVISRLINSTNLTKETEKYFIYTTQCRVPYVDPFSADALKIFNPKKFYYTNCTNDEAFITSKFQLNTKQHILHINIPAIERAVKDLNASSTDVRCCYRQIVRSGSDKTADNKYRLLNCTLFLQDCVVPQNIDYIITECYYIANNRTNIIQSDAFSFIQHRNSAEMRSAHKSENASRKPSILLLGIDSLSRINLRRTMPQTFKYLQMDHWFELQGYNKVSDNTFPNLMALLTSYNQSTAYKRCKPKSVGGLNKPVCNLIWNNFKQYGYKTAYAEDECSMGTFNYLKKGFLQPPTDYYLRPMLMAISKNMVVKKRSGLLYCIGRKHSGEYVFDYALQFANALPADPLFGLFWTNSFSHNSFDLTATMDVKILEYLKEMKSEGILERAIVLFFGDHGSRFGPLLKLKSGFLEERLPMMFISLPTWYRNEHSEFVEALKINQNRLTTPYDIYATMKQILEETDPEKEFPYLNDTVKGLSIFREIPENRTCQEAGIIEHWCTCNQYEVLPTSSAKAKKVALLVIDKINQYLEKENIGNKCSILNIKKLLDVKLKIDGISNQSTYRIKFLASPKKPEFEATVVYNGTSETIMTKVEDISRLNSYKGTSGCIGLKEAKKFCICKNKTANNVTASARIS